MSFGLLSVGPQVGIVGAGGSGGGASSGVAIIEGASVAECLSLLAALPSSTTLAVVTVTGQAPRLMDYDADDDAWYGTDGGDGSELTPFWTASSGEDGLDALPAATSGAYAVIAKGSGSPQAQRGLVLLADGALTTPANAASIGGWLLGAIVEWVTPVVFALGTPSTCYVLGRAVTNWTPTAPAGSAFTYNSTLANRVAVLAGTSTTNTASIGTRSTSSTVGLLVRRLSLANPAAAGSSSFMRVLSSSDSGQFGGFAAGGSTGSATNYSAWNASAALVDTGIPIATEKALLLTLNIASNAINIRVNGAATPTYTGTSVVTTASTAGVEIAAAVQTVATRWGFQRAFFMEWN